MLCRVQIKCICSTAQHCTIADVCSSVQRYQAVCRPHTVMLRHHQHCRISCAKSATLLQCCSAFQGCKSGSVAVLQLCTRLCGGLQALAKVNIASAGTTGQALASQSVQACLSKLAWVLSFANGLSDRQAYTISQSHSLLCPGPCNCTLLICNLRCLLLLLPCLTFNIWHRPKFFSGHAFVRSTLPRTLSKTSSAII